MKDLTGLKLGRILVVGKTENRTRQGNVIWECHCDCGEILYKSAKHLAESKFLYGCKKCRDSKRDPYKDRKLYRVWINMKKRCSNKSDMAYGGRGITVCDEWANDFFIFRDWAYENGYNKHAKHFECTIDRINYDGNYEPQNCRWISMSEQNCNKRNNRFITIDGKTQCASKWLEELNVKRNLFYNRLRRGWSEVEALTSPLKREGNYKNPFGINTKNVIASLETN